MKHVVSISLGSSKRDHRAVANFGGQDFLIERIGTDGDKEKAIELIRQLDGTIDAFGMGGTDLYIYAGNKRYTFAESSKIAAAAKKTPIVDGSGIKNTLERGVIQYLAREGGVTFKNKPVLIVCAVDRFGLAEELAAAGSKTVFGDLLFGMGLPIPIHSLKHLAILARVIAPIITKLPVSWFYPTGDSQVQTTPRFSRYFQEAEMIAGDFHFIRRYMPTRLDGKIIITNTVTQDDEKMLKTRGVHTLITTTPEFDGRSFGTNVLEGVLVALAGKRPEELTLLDYQRVLAQINIMPRIKRLS